MSMKTTTRKYAIQGDNLSWATRYTTPTTQIIKKAKTKIVLPDIVVYLDEALKKFNPVDCKSKLGCRFGRIWALVFARVDLMWSLGAAVRKLAILRAAYKAGFGLCLMRSFPATISVPSAITVTRSVAAFSITNGSK